MSDKKQLLLTADKPLPVQQVFPSLKIINMSTGLFIEVKNANHGDQSTRVMRLDPVTLNAFNFMVEQTFKWGNGYQRGLELWRVTNDEPINARDVTAHNLTVGKDDLGNVYIEPEFYPHPASKFYLTLEQWKEFIK